MHTCIYVVRTQHFSSTTSNSHTTQTIHSSSNLTNRSRHTHHAGSRMPHTR
ncbi:hypothetical protein BofuT4_uP113990.1 [Botrytis cinerea T4]|uniref:Uncharacterized protein n=1 Tax=Botryotinia fuckeliana (strain T4) TaxID=999810 RepID=G2Y5F5_BOTF4|nr:hypothetical protein BofuT4_uP113990.1 [Botrytis cinerea T4]